LLNYRYHHGNIHEVHFSLTVLLQILPIFAENIVNISGKTVAATLRQCCSAKSTRQFYQN